MGNTVCHTPNHERPRKGRPVLCLQEVKWNSLQKSFMTTIKIPSSLRILPTFALAINLLVWGVGCCSGREAVSDFCHPLYSLRNFLMNADEGAPLQECCRQSSHISCMPLFSTDSSASRSASSEACLGSAWPGK